MEEGRRPAWGGGKRGGDLSGGPGYVPSFVAPSLGDPQALRSCKCMLLEALPRTTQTQ